MTKYTKIINLTQISQKAQKLFTHSINGIMPYGQEVLRSATLKTRFQDGQPMNVLRLNDEAMSLSRLSQRIIIR